MKNFITSFDDINRQLSTREPSALSWEERDEENEKFSLRLQQLLELLGSIESANSGGDFFLQRDAEGSSASITLTTRTMWHESTLNIAQQCLREYPTQRYIYIDSSLELEQPIYILVFSDHSVGHAENSEWLVPFGFDNSKFKK